MDQMTIFAEDEADLNELKLHYVHCQKMDIHIFHPKVLFILQS